ncbi:MAG TPA: phosphatase PAP2 family protein [Acidimicrobiales bacterium]|nr:phosphatase PAP2 family protein [Acidimicrobiales bacterium]
MEHGLPEGMAAKLGPLGRYELRALLLALALGLVGVPFGFLLHQVATHGPITGLDEDGAQWLNDQVHDHDLAITVLKAISFTGKPIFLLFAIGLPGAWILRRGGRKLALFLAVTCIGGGIVDTIVKVVVGRPRPHVEEPITTAFGNSFPSGHSMASVVCYGALLLVFLPMVDGWRRTGAIIATATIIVAIGFSRLTLGVHYVSDVLGGYVLGAAWLIGSVAAFEIWREERGKRPTAPLVEGIEPEEAKRAAKAN